MSRPVRPGPTGTDRGQLGPTGTDRDRPGSTESDRVNRDRQGQPGQPGPTGTDGDRPGQPGQPAQTGSTDSVRRSVRAPGPCPPVGLVPDTSRFSSCQSENK
ncbi:hypothetical protein F2P81_025505 [Scophthalmus maximus]|uniref:Uncharacterized protein n=1 Tax=Scophthalmus maximus TaxID=52904 RepID=A0A6A4RK39_SCOMX|nr:hypothetical protein F2P81_025505 [Scophthalmus maximus]